MRDELFPFQRRAVGELRLKVAAALNGYRMTHTPQVVSFTAPTGSGKTIIMAALIEDIFFGTDQIVEQPEAIFVWLSDSPQLNAQSKDKIDVKADKIRFGQCVTIEEESFDMETLEEGHIYFLNTQKLGRKGKLSRAGDGRTWTKTRRSRRPTTFISSLMKPIAACRARMPAARPPSCRSSSRAALRTGSAPCRWSSA